MDILNVITCNKCKNWLLEQFGPGEMVLIKGNVRVIGTHTIKCLKCGWEFNLNVEDKNE